WSSLIEWVTNIDTTHSVGAGYNPGTGIFTAPLDGLYVFSMTLSSGYNDIIIMNAFRFPPGQHPSDLNLHSQKHRRLAHLGHRIRGCCRLESMSIRHTHPEAHALEGAYKGAGQSMFSGFLPREHLGRESITDIHATGTNMSAVQRCFIAVYLMSFCFPAIKSKSQSNKDDLAHQFAELKETFTNLEGKYDKAMSIMTDKLLEQEEKVAAFKDELQLYKGLHVDRRQEVESAEVAFFAYITNDANNIGSNQVVVFDHVITNIDTTNTVGAGYNRVTGTFTAPVDGMYVFSMTLLSQYNDYSTHYAFYQDNTPLTSIYIHGHTGSSHTWDIGSADAIVSMTVGQTMSIRHTHQTESHALEGAYQRAGQSMFSGFLLREHFGKGNIVG
ncbi:hypothetical protein MAR_036757, partial [Mya arenaria]